MVTIVTCPHCDDTGQCPVADPYGEFEMMDFCLCDAGVDAEEWERLRLEAIDHAEADALYAWQAACVEEDRRAMPIPALDEPPF